MGDIVEKIKIKSILKKKPQELNVYFDSGSPFTFVSKTKAKELGGIMKLPQPCNFSGLGDGKFQSDSVIQLWFDLLGIWCRYIAYVVPEDITGNEDVLCGHDFMQLYNIKLDLKKKRIILDKKSLQRAQIVRKYKMKNEDLKWVESEQI